jgi:hypothetical protein
VEEDKTKVVDEKNTTQVVADTNTTQVKDDKVIPQIKDDKGTPEWLAPILSALGGMGGSYMLFIKPLQERIERLVNQMTDLRAETKELKQQNKEMEKSLKEIETSVKKMQESQSHANSDYLPTNQPIGQGPYVKKRF